MDNPALNPKFNSGDYEPLASFPIAQKQCEDGINHETKSYNKDKFDIVVIETLSMQHIFVIEKVQKQDFVSELSKLFGFYIPTTGYPRIKLSRDPELNENKRKLFMFSEYL